jgi:hypothetical protein
MPDGKELAMAFLSELLHNHLTPGWGELGGLVETARIAGALEAALNPIIAAAGASVTPSLALRAEELVVAWLVARRMEDILRTEGVCRMQDNPDTPDPETTNRRKDKPLPKVFKEVHPMVEKAMKARERVRKALQELEEACKATAASGGTGALGDEVTALLRLGDGVLDDALAFEKRKTKRARRAASGAKS